MSEEELVVVGSTRAVVPEISSVFAFEAAGTRLRE
jgi:hypothetical protein